MFIYTCKQYEQICVPAIGKYINKYMHTHTYFYFLINM